MAIRRLKEIILKRKFLEYSAWQKFIKRNLFALKRLVWRPQIRIAQFPFKQWGNVRAESLPPEKTGWEPLWSGYWEMKKTFSPEFRAHYERINAGARGLTEDELDKQCFLSVVNEIKDDEIKMLELGAGTGTKSLALAGTVDFGLVPNARNKTYRCLAVEAEPTHFSWTVEHFKKQNIKGEVVQGAVSDREGFVNFDVSLDPASFYGQTVVDGKGYQVKSFTVDELIEKYNFPKVNIIHADLQGSELRAVKGAEKSIKKGLIDYWIFGTHQRYLEEKIIRLTKDFYDVILYVPQKSGLVKHAFYGWIFIPVDGLLILRHKNLLHGATI